MKKTMFLMAFLTIGLFCLAQNERPYIIKYKTQSDTVYLNTRYVNDIHVDAGGQVLIHDNGTEWSSLTDLDTVYVYRSEIINPNYVPINWNNATLLSSNDSLGNYQIQFDGELPELQTGSIITIDQDTVVHYVFVVTETVDGNIVTITSTEAYLTDIFADVDFTLTTVESGKFSASGNVFYPVAAYIQDEQGVCRALDLESQRDDDWGFTHDLWQYGANFDGENIFTGDHYSVYMERMNFNFDFDLDMYMNFSGRDVHEIVGNFIDRYRSRALNVNATLHGTFETEQRIRCDVEGSFDINPDYDIWKHNFFRPLPIRFVVYGVPIVITLNSDLYRQVQLSGNGEISAYTGFADYADGRMGFEWRQGDGMSPVSSFSNTFDYTPPTLEGNGTVQGQVWVFPRIRLILEYALGPSFDFKPYLSVTVSGGFKEELLGQSNDFCAWSLDCNTGLDIACGLSIQHPMFAYEVENYSILDSNFIDRPLYHSPKRIQKVSLEGSGQTKTASFNVFDQNYLFNAEVLTPLPQFVKFEADGEISSEYGIAQNGQVTVDWTPSSNDILYAKLYNMNGNVMAWDTVHAPIELPSVYTVQVTNIGEHTAIGGGNVTDDGGGFVTARGICWNTSHNPDTTNSHTTSGSGTGAFTANMTGLLAHTTYYVRAYATNDSGTAYGEEVSFTTLTTPTVTTAQVTNIGEHTASGGGNVTDDGGSPVTVRGICWSTNHNPTISNSHVTSGSGTGTFTVNMTDLTANTTYFVRAYATNSVGTKYGNEVSFCTTELPMVTTAQVTNVTQTTAIGGGTVTCSNGCEVTERGICWSTNSNPTINGTHATSGMGTGTFTRTVTGLIAETTYYVRAYAVVDGQALYGNEVHFTTLPMPTVITLPVTNITVTTAMSGGNVISDAGSNITGRGICWSTSHNPTTSDLHISCGTGTGTFNYIMKRLTPNVTYYVRAYAIINNNDSAPIYGNEEVFSTIAGVYYGDGLSIDTLKFAFPAKTLWNYSIATCLYRAAELSGAGVTTAPITSLSWYCYSSSFARMRNTKIWMANVSNTTVSAISPNVSGMTLVYESDATNYLTVYEGWNEFCFNRGSFAWDGHSNILILVQRNDGVWMGTKWRGLNNAGFISVSYLYRDDEPYHVESTTYGEMNLYLYRPDIIFNHHVP